MNCKIMKRCIYVFVLMLLLLPGCGTTIKESDYYVYGMKIIHCLDENDSQGLKEMFCPKVVENVINLDEQIETAMKFYNGEMLSYGSITGGEGETYDEGQLVKKRISPRYHNIKTSSGDEYQFLFYAWVEYDSSMEKVGISEIVITDESGNQCTIGDYYLVNPEMMY